MTKKQKEPQSVLKSARPPKPFSAKRDKHAQLSAENFGEHQPQRRGIRVKVLIHKAEEGGYWAQVPALPGCVTEGNTREELLANVREAIEGILLSTSGTFEADPGGREEELEL
jgi:HicB_like antitoxin of bacterial toxin-antitoxin system